MTVKTTDAGRGLVGGGRHAPAGEPRPARFLRKIRARVRDVASDGEFTVRAVEPGDVFEVPDREGRLFAAQGVVEWVEAIATDEGEREVAVAAPAPETTRARAGRRGRRAPKAEPEGATEAPPEG